ncbi:hypothetical protein D9743_02835 [Staphylococcus aureus]|uniref:Uncharacterized protein n=1 Tax=Staphylococcus aureus TaxID=1280 RepID=A0AAX2YSV3_STAAU|nr:hypothetical protein D1F65_08400 [Staphylococcus aureus]PZP90507.1 MAG: hypothetical protein DI581_12330 [Staphylococcus capitis]AZR71895.1 hypothetical protein DKK89_11805 [Staphylococcus aureus]KAA0448633.1 hypothetical protein FQP77_03870 [Staphylococcus aureus]KAA0453831.1 hypothetical protein FQP76_05480 [Staphylococcus aureus]
MPSNLWIDGHQTEIELTAVKTKKENCYHSRIRCSIKKLFE